MKKTLIILLIVVVNQLVVFSQETKTSDTQNTNSIIIKGTLSELVNNKKVALPFANVFIEGTTIVGITDFDGNFILETVPGSYNLKCTFMGYDSFVKSIDVNNVNSIELDILLKPLSTTMLTNGMVTKNQY